jgi:hypothetical protein
MLKVMLPSLLSILTIALASCSNGGSDISQAGRPQPSSLLLTIRELPRGTTTGEIPPELCGPLPVLQKSGGQTAISKTIGVGKARVAEAVGLFDTPAEAKSAFNDLNNQARLKCIASAISTFGSAASVKAIRLQLPHIGDDDAVVRYISFNDDESKPVGYSDVGAIRVDRCTAALLIVVEGSHPPDSISEATMEAASNRLSRVCD